MVRRTPEELSRGAVELAALDVETGTVTPRKARREFRAGPKHILLLRIPLLFGIFT